MKAEHSLMVRQERRIAIMFIIPFFLGIVVFYLIPIIIAFSRSLTEWKGYGEVRYIGLENYRVLFADPVLYSEIWNTLRYVVLSLPTGILIALFIAELLNKNIRGRGIYRVIYYLPNITMTAVVFLIWKMMLNSRFGPFTLAIKAIFGSSPSWLSDPKYVMFALVMMSLWTSLGHSVIFLLSGLQAIPHSLSEACRVDGGTEWTCFFRIKLPLITPTIFYLLIIGIIGGFNQFDLVFLISSSASGGGLSLESPIYSALRTMVAGIYNSGFIFADMGYACAKSVILFAIIMVITIIQFILQKKWVNY